MAEKTQPKSDNAAMVGDYNQGMTLDQLAEKYNLTANEVESIVVQPVPEDKTITQAELDAQEAKKGK